MMSAKGKRSVPRTSPVQGIGHTAEIEREPSRERYNQERVEALALLTVLVRLMPRGRVSETRYEDLVADPSPHIHRIYSDLGLEVSARFSRRLAAACDDAKRYRANPKTPLPRETIAQINVALAPLFERWGYPMADDETRPVAAGYPPVTDS